MKIIRWRAVGTLVGTVGLIVLLTWLFLDTLVKRGIEKGGTLIAGAKVELKSATVHLVNGSVVLRGLQVADRSQPMQNLVEAAELQLAIKPAPLFEKKLVVDSMLARDVRFGTPRTTSGAVDDTSSGVGQRVAAWASQVRIPSFSLEGLGKEINLPSLDADSLRTTQQARAAVQLTDSARHLWEGQVRSLDPQPKIDSGRALLERLKGVDPKSMSPDQLRQTVASARTAIGGLTSTLDQVRTLRGGVDSGVARLRSTVNGLDDARRSDYAYARGLIKLPSLDPSDISPALFGRTALERVRRVIYWMQVAEQYIPPGLDPRAHSGPKRVRMAGTTVDFPRANAWPTFLLRYASLDLTIGGEGGAAGAYSARLAGLTTEPALYGQPLRFIAGRTGGRVGPRDVRAAGILDHVRAPVRDSIYGSASGLALPTLALLPVKASAVLGDGTTEISLLRRGGDLTGRWSMTSSNVTWQRLDSGAAAPQGLEDVLWRAVSGMKDVRVAAEISGGLDKPSLAVSSNVGTELAKRLRQELGAKVDQAEAKLRARVDSLVGGQVAAARQHLDGVQNDIQGRLAQQQGQLESVRGDLEKRVRELVGGISLPGIKLPGRP